MDQTFGVHDSCRGVLVFLLMLLLHLLFVVPVKLTVNSEPWRISHGKNILLRRGGKLPGMPTRLIPR